VSKSTSRISFNSFKEIIQNPEFISTVPRNSMAQEGDLLAKLAVLNYEKLVKKDPAEASKLLFACAKIGFFYLDLSSVTAEKYRNLVSALNRESQEYFSRPLKEKLKDMNSDWEVFNICG